MRQKHLEGALKFIMKIKTDKNIKSLKSNWKFDKNVAKNFDSHVTKSVPMYDVSHDLCVSLSEFFLKENGRCFFQGSCRKRLSSRRSGAKLKRKALQLRFGKSAARCQAGLTM